MQLKIIVTHLTLQQLKKWILRFIWWAGVPFIFLTCVSLAAEKWATPWAMSLLNQLIPGSCTARNVDLSIFRLKLSVDDLSFYAPNGNKVIHVKKGSLGLSWVNFLRGHVLISPVVLDQPEVFITYDKNGRTDLIDTFVSQETDDTDEPLDIPLTVSGIDFSQGFIRFHMPEDNITIEGLNIAGQGTLGLSGLSIQSLLMADQLTYTDSNIRESVENITISSALLKNRLRVKQLRINKNKSKLDIAGRIGPFEGDIPMALSLAMDLDLDSLLSKYLVPQNRLSGIVTGIIHMSGTCAAPVVDINVSAPQLTAGDTSLSKTRLHARLVDGLLNLKSLNATYQGFVNHASGKTKWPGKIYDLPEAVIATSDRFSHSYDITTQLPDMSSLISSVDEMAEGKTNITTAFTASGIMPEDLKYHIYSNAEISSFLVNPMTHQININVKAEAAGDLSDLEIKSLSAVSPYVTISGHGTVDIDELTVMSELTTVVPELSGLLAFLDQPGSGTNVICKTTVTGPLKTPETTLTLSAGNLGYDDLNLGELHALINRNKRGVVTIKEATLSGGDLSLVMNGTVRPGPDKDDGTTDYIPDVKAEITIPDLGTIPYSEIVHGKLSARIKTTGTLSNIGGTMDASVSGLSVGDITIGEVNSRSYFNTHELHLKQLKISQPNNLGSAVLKGRVNYSPPPAGEGQQVDANLSVNNWNLAGLAEDMSGTASMDMTVGGAIQALSGSLRLSGKDITMPGMPVCDMAVSGDIQGGTLHLINADITPQAGGTVKSSGWVSLDQTFDLSMSIKDLPVQSLFPSADLSGIISANASGAGSFSGPVASGKLMTQHLRFKDQPVENINITSSIKNSLVTVDGTAGFDISGEYHLKNQTGMAQMVFHKTDVGPWLNAAGFPDITSSITGSIDFDMPDTNLKSLKAACQLPELSVRSGQHMIISGENTDLSYQSKRLEIKHLDVSILDAGWLKMAGYADLNGPIDFTINGNIPLESAKPFIDEVIEPKGNMKIKGHIGGTVTVPSPVLTVTTDSASFTVPDILQSVHGLTTHIEMTPDLILIKEIAGKLDDGSFRGKGKIQLSDFRPSHYHLSASASNLMIQQPDTLDITSDIKLTAIGPSDDYLIAGSMTLLEGLYYKDIQVSLLDPILTQTAPRTIRVEKKNELPTWLGDPSVNVVIRHRQPFIVDNNLATLEVRPDIRIRGRLSSPVLQGRAQAETGIIRYRKKEFELEKGVIDFVDPLETKPEVDIKAVTTIRDWVITLSVTGPPENLDITLTSIPPEERADIVSILLFGRPMREMNTSSNNGGTSPTALLAELIVDYYGEDIRKSTGIDILEVGQVDPDENGVSGTKVTVGKTLTRQLTVKYAVEVRDQEVVQSAISEYRLMDYLLINGFQSTNGNFGGELVLRVEFR